MNQGPEKAHFLARFWHHFSTSAAGKQLWVPKTAWEEVDFFGVGRLGFQSSNLEHSHCKSVV